ncbi:MAG TPA: hypothetical protein VMW42_13370 [Desulfatiglandales bacterium]|nr:hypothetical protein [Desulfatiglandales bacterium]
MKDYYGAYKRRSLYRIRILDICCFLIVIFVLSVISLYFMKKDFAAELRQVSQAKPNKFYIGIDVSQTIKQEVLNDFKGALISRLKIFTGEQDVFYNISIFGIPGCGKESIADVVSAKSPNDPESFRQKVEKRIKGISIARKPKAEEDKTPLTTPLHSFLDKILTENSGHRVIILSDLVNDEIDCQNQHSFPLETIKKFGADKEGQIIFLYPAPYITATYDTPELNEKLLKKQRDFIMTMSGLSRKGEARVFFYRIPDDTWGIPHFFKSQLQKSIPATTFEIIWERVSKMIHTVVGAVRG